MKIGINGRSYCAFIDDSARNYGRIGLYDSLVEFVDLSSMAFGVSGPGSSGLNSESLKTLILSSFAENKPEKNFHT